MAGNLERYAADTPAYPASKRQQISQASATRKLLTPSTPPPKIPRFPPP